MTAEPPTETPTPTPPPRLATPTLVTVGVLLVIPLVALALVPVYSHEKPAFLGFPFFYWYQMLWVLLTPALTYSAYVVIKRARGQK